MSKSSVPETETDKAFQWRRVNNVVATLSKRGEITDEEWGKYLDVLRHEEVNMIFAATSRDAASISATQRKLAAEVMNARSLTAIVVTDDRIVRGALTALSWMGSNIRPFPWKALDDALDCITDAGTRQEVGTLIAKSRPSLT